MFSDRFIFSIIMTEKFDELKVLPGENLNIQHIVLVMDARVMRREERRFGIQGSNGGI